MKFIKKKLITLIIGMTTSTFFLIFSFIVILLTCIGGSGESGQASGDVIEVTGSSTYPDAVEQYREEVEKACKKFDNSQIKKQGGSLENYVDLALAIMTEESHGAGTDPMQASECGFNKKYPRRPGAIQDPIYSIECGIQYMRNALITAKVSSPTDFGKIGIAVQGYNFGIDGWVSWIKKNGNTYTVPLATQYSLMMQKKLGWTSSYGCPTHGEKVLTTYKLFLNGQSENGESIVNTKEVNELIQLSEVEAWNVITNNRFSSKPAVGSVTSSTMSKFMKTITVNTWDWKNNTGTEKTTNRKSITVHKAFASFWEAFFEEIYNDASKIVIHELSGYCFRLNTPQTAISAHSFGIAIDINWSTKGNGYGQTPYTKKAWEKLKKGRTKELTIYQGSPLVEIAKKYTLNWGGDWSSTKDGMHFSFCGDSTR